VFIEAPSRHEAMPVPEGVSIQSVAAPASASKPRDAWYWRARLDRSEAMRAAVDEAIDEHRPDVVVGQLHGGPGALAAAAKAGVARVLVLHSYEALCKVAFDPGSECRPPRDCAGCPHAAALPATERAALLELRARHSESVTGADALVAPSDWMAATLARWSGRRATVVRYALMAPSGVGGDYAGPVVIAANRWTAHKGVDLLPFLVDAARRAPGRGRTVRVTRRGLDDGMVASLMAAGAEVVANAPFATLADGASAVVIPSQWEEPFGRLAWEAMAAGIPALASDSGGLAEFVPSDLLVTPRESSGAWSGALDRLFSSREGWDRAAAEGLSAAEAILDRAPGEHLESVLMAAGTPAAAVEKTNAV
jgi:hypothetical protein